MTNRRQLTVFLIMLLIYALAAFISYAFLGNQITSMSSLISSMPARTFILPMWVYGLENAGIILVGYGLLGLLGYWLARRVGLPGMFSRGCGWRRWVGIPFLLAIPCALFLIAGDLVFAPINGLGRYPHPLFPFSILASLSAGIGEEIIFRGFLFGLWALLLTWVLKRLNGHTTALWIANVIAAVLFAAGHMPSVAMMTHAVVYDTAGNATFLFEKLSPVLVVEVFLLNGIVGVVVGWCYIKDGLVAATGVHFWTDIFWHVVWGLVPA